MHTSHRSSDPHRTRTSSPTAFYRLAAGVLSANGVDSIKLAARRWKPAVYLFLLTVIIVASLARFAFAAPPSNFKGVIYDGKPYFVHGINLPWIRWGCDFGSACDIRETEPEIRQAFQDFRNSDVNVVRWWLFPGNPVTYPEYGGNVVTLVDSSGKPTDFHPDVYADIEYVLDLAREYGLKLNFTIYSSHMDLPDSWREDPAHRQALADLLGRLAGRFASRPEVFAWELFNEPEAGLGNPEDSNPYARNVKELTRLVIAAQRQALAGASPRALINLGPDRVKPAHFEFWKSLDVDFWSPHFYDNMTGETSALETTAEEIRARHGITQPILLGELYLGRGTPPPNNFVPPSVNLDPLARYEDVLNRGYAGAWGWAYYPQNDGLTVDMEAARVFASRYPELIGPHAGTGSPPSTPVVPPSTPVVPPSTPVVPPSTPVVPPSTPVVPPSTPVVPPSTPVVPPPILADLTPIFDESLAADWSTAQSWSGTVDTVAGAGVLQSTGLRFACDSGWCGLRFNHAPGLTLSAGSPIGFQYRSEGSPTDVTYKVFVNGPAGLQVLGYITASSDWQKAVYVLDSDLAVEELVLQEHHGSGANTIVVDNVAIGTPGMLPEPLPTVPPTLPTAPALPTAPVLTGNEQVIFTDGLSQGWLDQSWSGRSESAAGSGPDGSDALSFACQEGWCGLRFVYPQGLTLPDSSHLTFSHKASDSAGTTYKVFVVDGSDTMHVLGYITTGADWASASFDLGSITSVTTVVLQEHHGTGANTILMDNLLFN